jgi:hypothetical protein
MTTEAFAGPLVDACGGDGVIEADADGLALGGVLGFVDGFAVVLVFADGFGVAVGFWVAAAVVGLGTGD